MNCIDLKNEKGFTLVELLLYLSVSAIIITVVSVFIITLNEVRIKNQVIATVEEQGAYIAGLINQHIRSAEKVLQPLSSGSSNNELILEIIPQEKSPTRIYLKEDIMMLSEGSSIPIPISDTRIIVSDLKFSNVTPSGSSGHIWHSFIIKAKSDSNRYFYEYTKTFESGASIRRN